LTQWLVTYQDGVPAHGRSPIRVLLFVPFMRFNSFVRIMICILAVDCLLLVMLVITTYW